MNSTSISALGPLRSRGCPSAISEAYSAADWGLTQFAAISDPLQRAVASDLVLSAVEGVQVNLRDLALSEIDVRELVGPNGQTMPGPDSGLAATIASKRTHRAVTDFARAFGSLLDCLAAAAIGCLGLPHSMQAASGAALLNFPELGMGVPDGQRQAAVSVEDCFASLADEPPGWLAWALELRDAVIHRGHLTQVWLMRPSPPGGPRFAVKTTTPLQYLIRMEPHVRGRPWHPDMLTLSESGNVMQLGIWLPEPTTRTVSEIKTRAVNLVDQICALLEAALSGDRTDWVLPEKQWQLDRVVCKPRTKQATRFAGFDPSYPTPPPSQMRVHSKSLPRLELAEKLRQAVGTAETEQE